MVRPASPILDAAQIALLRERDLQVIWHPCMQQRVLRTEWPLPVVGAQGSCITLADGRQLIDGISSWWCKSLGHGHPRLMQALIEQTRRFEHVMGATTVQEGAVRLGERLVAMAGQGGPGRVRHVFYAGDGSCGVEIALKMALQGQRQRGRTAATRIAAFANGYHGETLACLSVTDAGSYAAPFTSWLQPCHKLGPLPWRSGPDDPHWMDASSEWPGLEAQLDVLAPALAAVIYEPVLQGAGGMRCYSPDLLPRLRRWADQHGVWLIADEIASGMGRCGAMLASHLAEDGSSGSGAAQADLVVMSKGLTGGVLPLTAVLASDEIFAAFDGDAHSGRGFLHSHTFGGNALGVAVAHAVLDVFAEEPVLGWAQQHGDFLRAGLRAAAVRMPQLQGVRGVGLVAAVDVVGRDGHASPVGQRLGWRIAHAAAERGALLRPLGDTLYLVPPLTITRPQCEQLLGILLESIEVVCASAGPC